MENIIAQEAATAVAAAGTNRIKEMFTTWKNENLSMKSLRSWSQFSDKTKFGLPKVMEVPSRLKTNVMYFQTNYIAVFLILVIYCIITNPWFLLSLAVCGGLWVYVFHVRKDPVVIANREITEKQKSIALLVVTVILFYSSGVTASIFWLLGATITVTLIHALLYTPIEETHFDFGATAFPPQGPAAV
eukprot:TRINITY_DN1881_c0_g1_i1.p1 TRINITY_DN1881_c0_g1~~TRINITY_DN1881_c0_g1_i1.p1  ORF type:complete len:188 (+),score=15.34 TRINITY_DN1881_c0_g1_i1:198-761(+)